MSIGRCAGCGHCDSSTKVKFHVLDCPAYAQLFREHPERCLDPVAERLRYKAEDDTSEARAERRDVRLQRRFAEMDEQFLVASARWRPPADILAD